MKYLVTIFSVMIFVAISSESFARGYRVAQVPNGSKFQCATCHIDPRGGGPRNPFGKSVEDDFLKSGDVQWGPELAMLDSDGDGFSNGEELQDPLGEWTTGSSDPGDQEMVFNPGDAASKPTTSSVVNSIVNNISVDIYPNPFFEKMTFSADLPKESISSIEIFDVNGNLVKSLNSNFSSGNILFDWDGRDNNNSKVQSGVYFISVRTGDVNITRNVILSR